MADTYDSLLGVNRTSTNQTSTANTTTPKKELDQASFLKLLTMQLSYQDPFKPVDNAQMLSQMTSMSTSEGISSLSTQMGSLNSLMTSSQALQASALVGQSVLIPSNTGYLEKGGSVSGMIATGDGASNLKVTVKDESGQVVKEFAIEGEKKGNVAFEWDGKDKDGNLAKSGKYQIEIHGTVNGKSEAIPALAYAQVESVTLGTSTNPSTLKLKGLGGIYLTDVLEIGGTTGKSTTTPDSTSKAVI
ncbi:MULTISPECIES: flagellar hook assembly protein FlgD [Aeromonas]|uniref:flagellar hook assembly protein FlgD n=1 Tax=Aeromonas TaxID=642 RepID=UPI00051BC26E|nr:flagellar hook assembly protein FlgD [Aeromonas aquatica]MCH7371120.1 flagellar hook assembly protein FlgD [Aeromonas sp. MR16]